MDLVASKIENTKVWYDIVAAVIPDDFLDCSWRSEREWEGQYFEVNHVILEMWVPTWKKNRLIFKYI